MQHAEPSDLHPRGDTRIHTQAHNSFDVAGLTYECAILLGNNKARVHAQTPRYSLTLIHDSCPLRDGGLRIDAASKACFNMSISILVLAS